MGTPEPALPVAETYAERERLATRLDDLGPEQWVTPSLCVGWRVREVVAHLTMPFRTTPLRLICGLVWARFSFDQYADRDARAFARTMSDDELLDELRSNIRHPWQPPGGGKVGALSHDVIHGLDITEPLGLPAAPPSRIALVLESAGPRNLKYFGVDLEGRRLVATDAEASIGDGTLLRMPVKEMLRVVTGRRQLIDIPGVPA